MDQPRSHNEDGSFAKGNQLRKGVPNSIASMVADLRKEFMSACTPERMKAATERLFEIIQDADAKNSTKALELLFDRLFGRAERRDFLDVRHTATSTLDASRLTDDQLRRVVAILDEKPKDVLVWDGNDLVEAKTLDRVEPLDAIEATVKNGVPPKAEEPTPTFQANDDIDDIVNDLDEL